MKEVSELIEAAQAGNSEAYAALLVGFRPMAYALAFRALKGVIR